MAEIVRMPKLSDTMTEGVIAQWHKKVGDKVKTGDLLAEIETDKATMEFESFQEGTLLYIGVETGKAAMIDSILAILGKEGEDISAIIEAEKKKVSAIDSKIPDRDKKNEKEEKNEKQTSSDGKAEKTGGIIKEKIHSQISETIAREADGDGRLKVSPLAKRLAKEKGMNLHRIQGSGDGGRVVKRDIENVSPVEAISFAGVERFTEVELSQMRKTIARRLAESKFSAPHFYLTIEIEMSSLMEAREAINNISNEKITYNDFIIKAVAASLRRHPKVNSSWLGDKIRYNEHIHIGVAVAVEDGLLVPVVKFADGKTLTQIAAEVKKFAEKAQNKKLQPQDWEGNTFTVSNLGMFGIEEFTAIINSPDACIMAVGAIRQTPVVKNGQVVPGNVMKVTLSCDHRAVDGATGASFLQTFKFLMENPVVFLGAGSL